MTERKLAIATKRGITYRFSTTDPDMWLIDVQRTTRNTSKDEGYILGKELGERLKSLEKQGYRIRAKRRKYNGIVI